MFVCFVNSKTYFKMAYYNNNNNINTNLTCAKTSCLCNSSSSSISRNQKSNHTIFIKYFFDFYLSCKYYPKNRTDVLPY